MAREQADKLLPGVSGGSGDGDTNGRLHGRGHLHGLE
jgi:hypothetical protein